MLIPLLKSFGEGNKMDFRKDEVFRDCCIRTYNVMLQARQTDAIMQLQIDKDHDNRLFPFFLIQK